MVCIYIWRPLSITAINRLESAIKWILCDNLVSYSSNNHLYFTNFQQLDVLPIKFRFDFHDLKIFHSIVYDFSCVKLPTYIIPYEGSRLRKSHLDHKSRIMPRHNNIGKHFKYNSSSVLSQDFLSSAFT